MSTDSTGTEKPSGPNIGAVEVSIVKHGTLISYVPMLLLERPDKEHERKIQAGNNTLTPECRHRQEISVP